MSLPSDSPKNKLWLAAGACLFVYLFFSRSIFLFIPVFALVLLSLWKRGGGDLGAWEDDDPADWWKKGKRSEER
ncbi:MAG TPA: hypothetical protein VL688_02280 [Verrucomicrobiae bacterium]|jgi:hypothetical protein|nr:hypothetical protein [Verrucomicrobiae bacterium]